MHNLAAYLANYIVENKITDESKIDECIYGLEVAFGKALNYSTLIVLAIGNRVLIPSVFFMIVFFSLRERTGGFHSKTFLGCYTGTVLIYVALIKIIIPLIKKNTWVYVGVLLFSWIVIIALAPVNHPNLRLDEQEIKECRKSSRWLLLFVTVCICISVMSGIGTDCLAYVVMGAGVDAILLCIAKLIGQEVK